MRWTLARLKEPSTWRGIILLLTVCGLKLQPEQQEAIIAAGLAVVGLIGVLTRDEPKQVHITLPPIERQGRSDTDDDDGYIARAVLRDQLRISVPPNHITGTEYDERQSGFNDR